MLSQTARQEILRKINARVGYQVREEVLSPATRQAITNLAIVQRHLFVITEILRGEKSRIEGSTILSFASKMGKDSGKSERAVLSLEINRLQFDVDGKVSSLCDQIVAEDIARQSGISPPHYGGKLELMQLKCPGCGASLPIPTSKFFQCAYCKSTFGLQTVTSQISSMIQSI